MRMNQWMTVVPAFLIAGACADTSATPLAPIHTASFVVNSTTCATELGRLESAISSADAQFTNEKDRQGALAKLATARTKLAQNKAADAVQKLTDIRTSAQTLISAGKLVDNAGLVSAVDAAIACINAANAA